MNEHCVYDSLWLVLRENGSTAAALLILGYQPERIEES